MDLAIAQAMIKSNQGTHKPYDKSTNLKKNSNTAKSRGAPNLTTSVEISDLDDEPNLNNETDDNKITLIKDLIFKANKMFDEKVNNFTRVRPTKTVVKFYVVFMRLGEIDNVQERFQADAYIESFWEDDSIDGKKFDPSIHWDPEIYIENAVGNYKQDVKYRVEKVGKKTRVYEMRKVRGFFWERLELQDFPLDEQDLSITITSSRSTNEIQFELSEENQCSINTDDFQQQQEWFLFTHINTEKRSLYDQYKDYERPAYTISSKIARRPGYFLNNAYMLIFFITILGFVPFSFACTSPHFRIQTTLLLILSSVNFRWIVTQRLPSISYLTILDKYAITALVFLVSLCCWHAIIGSPLFADLSAIERNTIDLNAFYIIAGLFLAFHLVYIFYFVWKFLRYKKIGIAVDGTRDDDKNSTKQVQSDKVLNSVIKSPIVNPTDASKKLNEAEIKYRNLIESPSGSLASGINQNFKRRK